ncbi:hypothetical protein M9H77_18374 [Catharanthus roseus]|uniref:Uncharacterized protein n=1 Tax=Catharanthus roseus TaxID=4058 RepID=A0ACC0B798_CATRO|nr:hypothetical protein M9H77_18374 [Catharanthus roseus]
MLGSVTLDLDPVDRGRSTVGGLGPRRYCVLLRIMLCGSGYFLAGWVRRGPPARVAQDGLVGIPGLVTCLCICVSVLRGTQVPYSAAVDLAEEYRTCTQKLRVLKTRQL